MSLLRELIDGLRSLIPGHARSRLIDKRGEPRLECHYLVEVESKGKKHRGIVTDVGPRGLRVKFAPSLNRGSQVSIHLEGSDRPGVPCRTAWCRKRRYADDRVAGFEFVDEKLEESWVGTLLTELGWKARERPQTREWLRIAANLSVKVHTGDDAYRGLLRDLGVGGCRLHMQQRLQKGPVKITMGPWGAFPELELDAEVILVRDEGGLPFDTRLSFQELRGRQARELGNYMFRLLREAHL